MLFGFGPRVAKAPVRGPCRWQISGGDSFFTYSGSYEVDDDRFTAALTTTRHAAGPPTLFGLDEVEVKLAGRFKGRLASCSGTAKQAPGLPFEATLIASEDLACTG